MNLLTALTDVESGGLVVILLCRSTGQLLNALQSSGTIDKPDALRRSCVAYDEKRIYGKVLKWLSKKSERDLKRRFLHTLVLMKRTRFPTATPGLCEAIVARANKTRKGSPSRKMIADWLNDLEDMGLVRRKLGGFVWIHTSLRKHLQDRFGTPPRGQRRAREQELGGWRPHEKEADVHADLAAWYTRVLLASNSPQAVFEAVQHLCLAAKSELRLSLSKPSVYGNATKLQYLDRKLSVYLGRAASLLDTYSFLIQTSYYSRSTCKRLTFIKESLCADLDALIRTVRPKSALVQTRGKVHLLQLRATEVMRAVAREVGEIIKAYRRQRDLVRNSGIRRFY